jgi:hypothetical protein
VLRLAVGKTDIPPVSGTGERWFDSSQPDAPWGNGCPASLMSSRSRFDSCRRYFLCWGRSSTAQSARLSGERPPVRIRSSPFRGGRGVAAAFAVVIRAASVRARPATSSFADAEHRRAQPAVTRSPRAVVVRLHPSALTSLGMKLMGMSTSLAPRRSGFDSRRLHFPASVVSTEARTLRTVAAQVRLLPEALVRP